MSEIALDNHSFVLLEYIYSHPYIAYASLRSVFPSYNDVENIILSFNEQHLISLRLADSPDSDREQYETYNLEDDSHLVTLTAGNAIIENSRRRTEEFNRQIQPLYDIADRTSSLAESASVQAKLAKEQAEKAKKTSVTAIIRANISFIVSILAAIAGVLANADSIVHNVQKILSYLGMQ